MNLKSIDDSISKVWKAEKVLEPFFRGGKVVISKDGQKLVCEFNGGIRIVEWGNIDKVECLWSDEEEVDDAPTYEEVATFCLHPNGQEIVIATVKFSLAHWSLNEKKCTKTIRSHRMPILCMEYDPSGTLVATGSADRTVKVWDILRGYCTHSFSNHRDIIKSLGFHPAADKLTLFATSEDNSVSVYDLRQSKCLAQFTEQHFSLATQTSTSTDGSILITCGRDKNLAHIKTVPIMEELETVAVLDRSWSSAVLSGCGVKIQKHALQDVVITAGAKGILKFYSMEVREKDAKTLTFTSLFQLPISAANFSTQGVPEEILALRSVAEISFQASLQSVVALTNDHNICVFSLSSVVEALKSRGREDNVLTLRPTRTIIGSQGDILDLARLPRGSPYDVALVSNSPQLRLMKSTFDFTVLDGHSDVILALDVSDDGNWIVTSGKDRSCRVWSVQTAQCRAVAEGHTEAVGAVCIAQSRTTYQGHRAFIVSGSGDKILKRWSLPASLFSTKTQQLSAKSAGSAPTTIEKLTPSQSVRAHEKDINCVTVSPNDQIVASASQDKTIRLWNAADLSPIANLTGHKRGVWKVRFSPVDKVLVSCSGDRTMKLWSLSDYSVIRTLEGHTASVLNAIFINNATQLISSSADGLVRLWTIRTGECVNTFETHSDRVWALDCPPSDSTDTSPENPDSGAPDAQKIFYSGGSDSKIVIWRDATQEEEEERISKAEEVLLLEQQLQNDIHHKRFNKAITAAIALNQPSKVLFILSGILEGDGSVAEASGDAQSVRDSFSENWSKRLDDVIRDMKEDDLRRLLSYMREWNTNSRNCYVCQILLNTVLRVVKVPDLVTWSEMREFTLGVSAYTERHFQRVNKLSQAAHFVDYVVSLISLVPMDALAQISVPSPLTITNVPEEEIDEVKPAVKPAPVAEVVVPDKVRKSRKRKTSD